MKPTFALFLSLDGIVLSHRGKRGWHRVGGVDVDAPDLPDTLRFLRRTASELEPAGLTTTLVIPNSQILYTSLTIADPEEAAIRRALEGLTPYAVEDLVFDWRVLDDDRVAVAVVARATLDEAEAFASTHNFNPLSVMACPGGDVSFPDLPWFGSTAAAKKLLPKGQTVEPDDTLGPHAATARIGPEAPLPGTGPASADTEESTASPVASLTPEPSGDGQTEAGPELADMPLASFSTRRAQSAGASPERVDRVSSRLASIKVKETETNGPFEAGAGITLGALPDLGEPDPITTVSEEKPALPLETAPDQDELPKDTARTEQSRAGKSELPAVGSLKPVVPAGANRGRSWAARSTKARRNGAGPKPEPSPKAAPPVPEPPLVRPKKAAPGVGSAAPTPPRVGVLGRALATQGSREADSAAGGGVASQPAAVVSRVAEGPEATPRGDDFVIRGSGLLGVEPPPPAFPVPLVAVLTLVLLLAVAVAAGLSTLVIGADERDTTTLQDPRETAGDVSDRGSMPLVGAQAPAEITLATANPRRPNNDDLDESLNAATLVGIDGDAPEAPETGTPRLSPVEINAQAGVPQVGTEPLPAGQTTDALYIASIDPHVVSNDALALLAPQAPEGVVPATPAALPPHGTTFTLNERGLVVPTPEGTLSPDGHRVFAGRPASAPPLRSASEAVRTVAEPDNRLAGLRPRLQPEGLVEANEVARLGGYTRAELATLNPRLRPERADPAELAERALASASRFAVETSSRPAPRPRDIDALVAASSVRIAPISQPAASPGGARTAPEDDGEPETVAGAPSIPTSTNVARQATLKNALNLRKVNLIGVYGSSGDRRALIRLSNGRYVKVKVGDRVDGGRVAAIGDNELRYVKSGRDHVLEMPKI